MAAIALSSVAFGQSANVYTFAATTGTYTELATGTDLPLVRADSYISPAQTIGFDFVYEGVTYTQFKMTSNGAISLNPVGTNNLTSNDFSTANTTSRPIIAPLWDDNDGNVSSPLASIARYQVSGTTPNQVLTVEWRYWQWNYNASGNTISHQI
ncbi:MAG: hypothetical protein IPN44_14505 [Flavobacteriales bacterium]|nr:hypothetical protein [Flavobacteriales bacterium]